MAAPARLLGPAAPHAVKPRVTIVIPAYEEDSHIVGVLDRLFEAVKVRCEALVVVDSADGPTVPYVVVPRD